MAVTGDDRTIARAQDDLFEPGVSPRAKYQALIVGQPGLGPLVRHELVTMVAQSMPGAAGLALRKVLYPLLLGACGRNVIFGQHVVLRHPHRIRIGDNVVIDDNCLLDAKGGDAGGITIGSGVFVGRNTILSCKNGSIALEDGANIGFNCEIFSASRVTVGREALVAAYCYLVGGDHRYGDPTVPVLRQARSSKGVHVGSGAWLGAGAKVLDGVRIGEGAIIGAGAVVRGEVPARAIAVGVPARVIGSREGQPIGGVEA
jgi:acetyltransferase-like isoleucine patch superfamily enzyme